MDEYTIYCTEEQTRKALELGAQIEFEQTIVHDWSTGKPVPYPDIATDKDGEPILIKPTAEQMIGFIEGQSDIKNIVIDKTDGWQYVIWENNGYGLFSDAKYSSRPKATLAAIDAALDFLMKNKK